MGDVTRRRVQVPEEDGQRKAMAKIEEIIEEEEEVPPKINNANMTELKTTSDDAIVPVSCSR
jgi:hypothetical protein